MQFLLRSVSVAQLAVRGAYIEEVQLISCASNGVCKQEDISLQPGYFHWRILEPSSWTRHFEYMRFQLKARLGFFGIVKGLENERGKKLYVTSSFPRHLNIPTFGCQLKSRGIATSPARINQRQRPELNTTALTTAKYSRSDMRYVLLTPFASLSRIFKSEAPKKKLH